MTEFQIISLAALAVVVYLYVRYRVAKLVQPLRLALVDRADALLKHSDLSQDDRNWVHTGLDMAYSARAAWLLALLILPMSITTLVRRIIRGRSSASKVSNPHSKEMNRFTVHVMLSVLASSPAAALVAFHAFIIGCVLLPTTLASCRSALHWVTTVESRVPHLHEKLRTH